MGQSLKGRLAVATPGLRDPNFAGTVVLIVDHGEHGAVGVVLNRPSRTKLASALPELAGQACEPGVVFRGGPVQPDAVLCVARAESPSERVHPILPGVAVVDLSADAALLTAEVSTLRVFAGYAGWGQGQLEAELAAGGWLVFPALADDVFVVEPEGLWRAVLRRQGGLYRVVPDDPTMN